MTLATPSRSRRPYRSPRKEKVRQYLAECFKKGTGDERLPSIRTIAQETGISVPTVYTVVREMVQQGKIRTEIGSGSFVAAKPGRNHPFRVAFNTPAGSPHHAAERWKNGVISGIIEGASTRQPRVMLLPSITPDLGQIGEELLRERDSVDALILFPSLEGEQIREFYEKAGKPVVSLNPLTERMTANFVSPDYYGASVRVGEAFRAAGRRRVAFVSHTDLASSVSSRLRLSGLITGIGEALGERISCRIYIAGNAHAEDGERVMRQILESGEPLPDAIYSVADPLAIGILRVLAEVGVEVPKALSIIGGAGLFYNEPVAQGMTASRQPLFEMGQSLLSMVCQRLTAPAPVPGVYVPMEFIGGATTLPEENHVLQITPSNPPGAA